jgi:hypothetical protein
MFWLLPNIPDRFGMKPDSKAERDGQQTGPAQLAS